MIPSAKEYRALFLKLRAQDPENERDMVVFSCLLSIAEATERLEAQMKLGVVPAIGALKGMVEGGGAVEVAPVATTDDLEPEPAVRATTSAPSPAAAPPAAHVSPVTVPVSPMATTSAPIANGQAS